MKRLRLYADTSVFGGCFDEEFADVSRKLLEEIRRGRFVLVVSETTLRELQRAPEEIRQVIADLPDEAVEAMTLTDEVERLRDAYVKAGVVSASSRLDAEHIACASVAGVDVVVSWNFKHIVNYEKIRGYHAVNLLEGYYPIPIHSPLEVVES